MDGIDIAVADAVEVGALGEVFLTTRGPAPRGEAYGGLKLEV